MLRTQFVVATLLVGPLVAAACGGSAGSAPDQQAENTRSGTVPTSSIETATASPSTAPSATGLAPTDVEPATTTTAQPGTTTTTTSPPTTTTTTTTTSPPTTTTTEPPPPEPAPPNVVLFLVSPAAVAPSEEVTVRWAVEGAEIVELVLPDGQSVPIEPMGSRAVALPLPLGSHTYVLQATNEDGMTVTRTRQVDVVEPRGEWVFNFDTDELTGDRKEALFVFSDDYTYPGAFDFGLQVKPALLIGCDQAGWTALTSWGDQYVTPDRAGRVAVAYRIDESDVIERTETWAGRSAVFVNDPEQFISNLLGKDALIYRVWNYDGTEVGTATFPIAHLEYRIDELHDCSL